MPALHHGRCCVRLPALSRCSRLEPVNPTAPPSPPAARPRPSSPPVALFDFDGVLVRGDSLVAFVCRCFLTRPWNLAVLVGLLPLLAWHLAARRPRQAWCAAARAALLGLDSTGYEARVASFARSFARRARPDGIAAMVLLRPWCRSPMPAARRARAAALSCLRRPWTEARSARVPGAVRRGFSAVAQIRSGRRSRRAFRVPAVPAVLPTPPVALRQGWLWQGGLCTVARPSVPLPRWPAPPPCAGRSIQADRHAWPRYRCRVAAPHAQDAHRHFRAELLHAGGGETCIQSTASTPSSPSGLVPSSVFQKGDGKMEVHGTHHARQARMRGTGRLGSACLTSLRAVSFHAAHRSRAFYPPALRQVARRWPPGRQVVSRALRLPVVCRAGCCPDAGARSWCRKASARSHRHRSKSSTWGTRRTSRCWGAASVRRARFVQGCSLAGGAGIVGVHRRRSSRGPMGGAAGGGLPCDLEQLHLYVAYGICVVAHHRLHGHHAVQHARHQPLLDGVRRV